MTAIFHVGDAIQVMNTLPEKSIDLVLSSPPFLALRSYLPADHPDKALEGGSQATPGAYIDWLVDVAEACARVLAPHGSLCFELGDTYSGSGESGWERYPSEKRNYRNEKRGRASADGFFDSPRNFDGWPLAKSLSLIPELFRLTLVYGTNPLTGRTTDRWRLRNVIRWVRPNPPVGALGDKFRPATSELMVFCKSAKRYFDLDAVREPSVNPLGVGVRPTQARVSGNDINDHRDKLGPFTREMQAAGAPPLDWWNIPPGGYAGAHYAVFPPELCIKPIKAMCPEKVCRVCGEPSRRIVDKKIPVDQSEKYDRQPVLAAHIREQRTASGFSAEEVNGWFGYKAGVHHWEAIGRANGTVPTPEVWPVLKERLGLSDEFDDLIYGDRKWADSEIARATYIRPNGEVVPEGGWRSSEHHRTEGGWKAKGRNSGMVGGIREGDPTLGFSDCGHDNWRPGLTLDPFVGSGTTLAVATGHGRDAIGIDLDERNYELALKRVGPLILQRGEVAA